MAVIHKTTMVPSKAEVIAPWLEKQEWFKGSGTSAPERVGGFRLDDPDGEVGIEISIQRDTADSKGSVYLVPLTYRGAPLEGAEAALMGTSEHGVLGPRWIYDGEQDPVCQAQLSAFLRGEVKAQHVSESNTADPRYVATVFEESDGNSTVEIQRHLTGDSSVEGVLASAQGPWQAADGEVTGVFATLVR